MFIGTFCPAMTSLSRFSDVSLFLVFRYLQATPTRPVENVINDERPTRKKHTTLDWTTVKPGNKCYVDFN